MKFKKFRIDTISVKNFDRTKLLKMALREAISLLSLETDLSYQTAYNKVIKLAKAKNAIKKRQDVK